MFGDVCASLVFLSYHLFRPLSYSKSLPLNLVLHVICRCIVAIGPADALDVDFVFLCAAIVIEGRSGF